MSSTKNQNHDSQQEKLMTCNSSANTQQNKENANTPNQSNLPSSVPKKDGSLPEQIEYINQCILKSKFNDALAAIENYLKLEKQKVFERPELKIEVLQKGGRISLLKGAFDESLKYFREAFDIVSQNLDENSPWYAILLHDIANVQLEKRQDKEALENLENALEASLKRPNKSSTTYACMASILKLARLQGKMNQAYRYLEKWAEALLVLDKEQESLGKADYLEETALLAAYKSNFEKGLENLGKALQIKSQIYDGDSVHIASVYMAYGELYMMSRKHKKANEHFSKALDMYSYHFGGLHHNVAVCFEKIGLAYKEKRKFQEAFSNIKKAYEKKYEIYEQYHPQIAQSHYHIAGLYEIYGRTEEALDHYDRAHEIYLDRFGLECIGVASCFQSIAGVFSAYKDYEKASSFFERSILVRTKCDEEESMDTARCYHNLGLIYAAQENEEKALESYNKAVSIYKTQPDHPDLGLCYLNISSLYEDKGAFSECIGLYQKALEAFLKTLGLSHALVAETYNRIGAAKFFMEDYNEASKYYEKGMKIAFQAYGENHYVLAMYYNNLSMAYSRLKDYKLGIEYIRKSLTIYQTNKGTKAEDLSRAYLTLGSLLETQRLHREAEKYYRMAKLVQRRDNTPLEISATNELEKTLKLRSMYDWEPFANC